MLRFPPRPPWLLGFRTIHAEFRGFDVVNAHTPYPTIVYQALQCARSIDAPLVVTHHNDFHSVNWLNWLIPPLANWAWMQPALTASSKVIATTKSYAETSSILANHLSKTVVLPLCHDFRKFHLPQEEVAGDYLLYVGRLIWYKNIDHAIRILDVLREEFPWLRLLIVGRGAARSRLEARVQNSTVRAHVEFLGYLDEEQLISIYQRAVVTLLPSTSRREAFGVVLVESMACGTPVVAYDIPGVNEVVSQSGGGLLARPGDVGHMVELVRSIIRETSLRNKLSRAGSTNVRNLFSTQKIVPKLIRIYQSVVEK